MKKLLSFVLALALALSLSVTAFAEDTTISPNPDDDYKPTPSTADTSVEFNVAPTYTITIPAKVELDKKTNTATGTVTYEKDEIITASAGVRLLNGQSIQVTLSAGKNETGFVLTSGEKATLDYTVTVGGAENAKPIASGDTVATFGTNTTQQTSTLHFAANDPTYAGQYSDTVTFTIAIESK